MKENTEASFWVKVDAGGAKPCEMKVHGIVTEVPLNATPCPEHKYNRNVLNEDGSLQYAFLAIP